MIYDFKTATGLRKFTKDSNCTDSGSVYYVITHFADHEGFFCRMQAHPPDKRSKKKKPFYWGLKSKKELKKQGIKV